MVFWDLEWNTRVSVPLCWLCFPPLIKKKKKQGQNWLFSALNIKNSLWISVRRKGHQRHNYFFFVVSRENFNSNPNCQIGVQSMFCKNWPNLLFRFPKKEIQKVWFWLVKRLAWNMYFFPLDGHVKSSRFCKCIQCFWIQGFCKIEKSCGNLVDFLSVSQD